MSDNLDISKIAQLARLKLSDEEAKEFTPQLETILTYIDTLNELDVSEIEPSAHPSPIYANPRPDVSRPSMLIKGLEQNAPKFSQDQVSVPRVVES